MSRLPRLLTMYAIVATVICSSISGCDVLQGCFQGNPERTFSVESLVLDRSAFPGTWDASQRNPTIPSNSPVGGMESIERTEVFFYSDGDVALQKIHRFLCADRAIKEFETARAREYKVTKNEGPWLRPVTLAYQSKIADRYHLACGMGYVHPTCRVIGQYAEYFVYLNVHMSPDRMTLDDLEKILIEMDRKLNTYLSH